MSEELKSRVLIIILCENQSAYKLRDGQPTDLMFDYIDSLKTQCLMEMTEKPLSEVQKMQASPDFFSPVTVDLYRTERNIRFETYLPQKIRLREHDKQNPATASPSVVIFVRIPPSYESETIFSVLATRNIDSEDPNNPDFVNPYVRTATATANLLLSESSIKEVELDYTSEKIRAIPATHSMVIKARWLIFDIIATQTIPSLIKKIYHP